MSDYQILLEKYRALLEDKSDVVQLKKEIKKLKTIITRQEKDKIELSYLITELMKKVK